MPSFKGDIENPKSTTEYASDLKYDNTLISFFGFDANFDTAYIPNVRLDYFNMIDTQNANFETTKELVGVDFNGSVSSQTNYQVFNIILHKAFHRRGMNFNMFGSEYYSGDFYFDFGINLKNIDYEFRIKQNSTPASSNPYEYITVKSNIVLPYFGMKYTIYNLSLFGNVSTLAIGDIRANSYKVGLDYRIFQHIALSGGYMYEDFQATEVEDKVTFIASGGYLSVKILF